MPKMGDALAGRPRMVTEERTLELLATLPPIVRSIATATYLVASFYPWWLILMVVALIAWQIFPGARILPLATAVFVVLAVAGWPVKWMLERLAPLWAATSE